MTDKTYNVITPAKGVPIKAWTKGVPLEDAAQKQLLNVAQLPFIYKWVAAMPDVHWGIGATVGSVIPTRGAIIPAAVGVDIGCGMMAVETSLNARDLPDNLHGIRQAIERAVPVGRTDNGGKNDRGAWKDAPAHHLDVWAGLSDTFDAIVAKYPKLAHPQKINHLGTLGTGNHFIEVCLDESESVWFLLHSGSRGVGNRFGTFFIELAKNDMRQWMINLPDQDLAYLPQGTEHFDDYVRAVHWAQDYALANRELMMRNLIAAVRASGLVPEFAAGSGASLGWTLRLGSGQAPEGVRPHASDAGRTVVSCHHNYVTWEHDYGENVLVTRKGAVRAREGDMGIIPGSMGARSYIVRGKGNPESFMSCSHGAGRAMSRTEAKRRFTVDDHMKATAGVECRKDADVIDETRMAYKSIDAVMEAQKDLVDVVHTLRQVVCVKGVRWTRGNRKAEFLRAFCPSRPGSTPDCPQNTEHKALNSLPSRLEMRETFPHLGSPIHRWQVGAFLMEGGDMSRSSFFAGLTGALVLVALAWFVAFPPQGIAGGNPVMVPPPTNDAAVASAPGQQMVVFAGGCFWGIQAVFQHVKGVISATSGYSGGKAKTAEYERVSTGMTGHAESVQVVFDPSQVTYGQLLHVFFSVAHDPTEKNRQGPDEGTQYRSVVFYSTEEQQKLTESYIAQLEAAHVFKHKIVTEVVPLKAFYPAEAHHQNYATLHPDEPYIRYNDAPKVEHLKEEFPMLYASK